MFERLIISGFGVIGTEVFHQIIKRNKFKKLHISVIEKKFSNFPGGVAYSKLNSKYGFFNNPLRLSNNEFKNWVKKNTNQRKLIKYFRDNKNLKLDKWLKKNVKKKKYEFLNLKEIYLPRSAYSFFLEEKFAQTLKILSKKKRFIKVDFYENELIEVLKSNKKYKCIFKSKLIKKRLIKDKSFSIQKNYNNKNEKNLISDCLILGVGILPPSNINSNIAFEDKNYIHDFYSSGGTNNLIIKLKNLNYKKNNIRLIFIGNKAGLLETMQEIENLNQKILKKLNIISISPSKLTLQKAEFSKKYFAHKFEYLIPKNIKKIKKAQTILSLIKNEFSSGQKKNFNKYDIWTHILESNILEKCYKKLNLTQKKIYDNKVFSQLRSLTRYTFPETINAKNRLEKLNVLKNLNDKVVKLKKLHNKIEVKTVKSGTLKGDIVVNVSGPVSLFKNQNEVPFLKSLKKVCKKFNERGFASDKFFQITNRVYAPGTLSSNFNPERKTIIKSITENCIITAKHFVKSMSGQSWN